jgi:hypothetical protein
MSSDVRSLDVIGDVHGSLDQLHALLTKLGYQESGGRWSSPSERRLVFLGDYIDRGRKPYETYRLVRGLCEQGIALAILGNHDTNAIQFCARRRDRVIAPQDAWRAAMSVILADSRPQSGWIRDHLRGWPKGDATNIRNHKATLEGMTAPQYAEFVEWLRKLPAWIELKGKLRMVHAAWMDTAISAIDRWSVADGAALPSLGIVALDFDSASTMLRNRLAGPTPYTDHQWCELVDIGEGREDACDYPAHTNVAIALERLTKGVELPLPDGAAVKDGGGIERRKFRARWYLDPRGVPIGQLALVRQATIREYGARACGETVEETTIAIAHGGGAYPSDAPPVLFGHYGLANGDRAGMFHPKCACVDYSGFWDGDLHAYRWDGEQELELARFESVPGAGLQAH